MTTPMRQQYLRIKKQFSDTIVFFRLGDFYETFDEDAQLVSQVCDIVLTSRPVGKGKRVPLAGVPHHSVESYIARLIHAGYKIAIVEQVEPPGEIKTRAKEIMPRQVVRVVTPGTVVEPSLLEEKRNNYLASLIIEGGRAGISYADITTGEFATTQFNARPERSSHEDIVRDVQEELERLQPAECLVPDDSSGESLKELAPKVHFTACEAWRFELENARQALLEHFGVSSLAGFGCEGLPLAVRAAGAIVQYLAENQKSALAQLVGLSTYSAESFMVLDAATRRNLELTRSIREGSREGSLLSILDRTETAMGGRLLRQWMSQPLLDVGKLNLRLDAVEALYNDTPLRAELTANLKGIADLERLANRVAQGIATPRDLLGIRRSLEAIPPLKQALESFPPPSQMHELGERLALCEDVVSLIREAISEDAPATLSAGGVIKPGFSKELDEIISSSRNAKRWVAELEQKERKRTGIKSLKVGYNKVFGYYIEVSKPNLSLVPEEYIRKQTLTNAERFITPQLKEYEALILGAQERIQEIEGRLFRQVCEQIGAARERILRSARALAEIDVYCALADVAMDNKYVRPTLDEGDKIEILAGRHPVVEQMLREEPFVPNDVRLSGEELILVITGPNMSGKSTFIRQTALIVLMAQIGSFVPAKKAHIGLVDRIFTRIGAQDEIAAGRSTFMVEMVETANILSNSTPRSLIILDEIGRGTSTYDGLAIARAVVEYIHNNPRISAKTLFATHYHELIELEKYLPRVRNYNVAVSEEGGRVVFLYKIVPGGSDRSYGIHVAQLAGIPKAVINRARELLAELEGKRKEKFIVQQLSLFGADSHPVLEELRQLKIDEMSPLEAINKLYELQRRAQEKRF